MIKTGDGNDNNMINFTCKTKEKCNFRNLKVLQRSKLVFHFSLLKQHNIKKKYLSITLQDKRYEHFNGQKEEQNETNKKET